MKLRLLSAACAAAFMVGVAGASAQTTTTTTTTVTTDQREKVVSYVKKQSPARVSVQEEVRVGATLPATVELRSFPGDVGIERYRYVYLGDRIALVQPDDRRIVDVIEVR
ncbi:MAG TPA: DUF1236 domain-containing protein [Beijerinckiaceae bacterium]|nr:DUF1236 domain-containing protein [Beijerinckiaceae bacterium]